MISSNGAMDAASPLRVELVVTRGKKKIAIGGVDITHWVRSLEASAGVGELTTITLKLVGIELVSLEDDGGDLPNRALDL